MTAENKLLNRLKSEGYRITPQRQEIIRVLSRRSKHQSAEEIYKRICLNYPNMGLDTVYRNLGLLQRLNIVSEINFGGKSRYGLNTEGDGHWHHIICLECGDARKVDFCPLDHVNWQQIAGVDFKVKRHRFEIFGYCSACLNKEAAAEGEGERD